MTHKQISHAAVSFLIALLCIASAHHGLAQQSQRTSATPENKTNVQGFSTERLDRLHAAMQREVDQKEVSGVLTLLVRHGELVEERTYGNKDIASAAPMTADTIFRIYSMSKPVTGVAMMILYEEGKWQPSDPSRSSFRNSPTSRYSRASIRAET